MGKAVLLLLSALLLLTPVYAGPTFVQYHVVVTWTNNGTPGNATVKLVMPAVPSVGLPSVTVSAPVSAGKLRVDTVNQPMIGVMTVTLAGATSPFQRTVLLFNGPDPLKILTPDTPALKIT